MQDRELARVIADAARASRAVLWPRERHFTKGLARTNHGHCAWHMIALCCDSDTHPAFQDDEELVAGLALLDRKLASLVLAAGETLHGNGGAWACCSTVLTLALTFAVLTLLLTSLWFTAMAVRLRSCSRSTAYAATDRLLVQAVSQGRWMRRAHLSNGANEPIWQVLHHRHLQQQTFQRVDVFGCPLRGPAQAPESHAR